MNEVQVANEIKKHVTVSRQSIVLAKSFILDKFNESTLVMERQMLEYFDAHKPEEVIIHPSVDPLREIKTTANAISWQLAFAEALWGLVGSAQVLPQGYEHRPLETTSQSWTSIVNRGGGQRAGMQFEEFAMTVPATVRKAPSLISHPIHPLSDADLFLRDLDIPNLHQEVETALRVAVECFRNELYLPSLAMMGLASEGAWIELGLALADSCKDKRGLTEETRENKREDFRSSRISAYRKSQIAAELYKHTDIFGEIAKRSGFNHRSLDQVLIWSNVVRDARNAIHYGTEPSSPNNYEKVAVLLLGASQNLKILYAILKVAEEL